MKTSKLLIILAILVMPLMISCSDGGDAFDVNAGENTDTNTADYTYTQEHITDLSCDADNECPEELSCWGLEGMGGPLCVDPDPEEWFCSEGTEAIVGMSYPPILSCQDVEEPEGEEEEEGEENEEAEEAIYNYVDEHITDLACDATTPCPDDLQCWGLDGVTGTVCVDPNPSQWHCEEGDEAVVSTSNPPYLSCVEVDENVSDTICTSDDDCTEDQSCWKIPDLGNRCVTGNPMEWYCDDVEGSFAVKFMSSPPEIRCMFLITE